MENLWLGNEPLKLGVLVDHKKMYQDTVRLLKEFGLNLDPRTKMKNLGVAQIQMLEIIKEVSREAKILIMDEPTSALTNAEVNQLFEIIRCLLYTSWLINLTAVSLILIGGLGFVVWRDIHKNRLNVRKYTLHTKMVLTALGVLVVVPTILFWILERKDVYKRQPVSRNHL